MSNLPKIIDCKPFISGSPDDPEISKNFYKDIGFKILWEDHNICEVDTGQGFRFLLLYAYMEQLGHHLMLHLWVDDVDEWYEHLKSKNLPEKYPGSEVPEPEVAPWGWRIVYLRDPAGQVWHVAEPHSEFTKNMFGNADWIQ